jgi:hypothetical protein
LEEGASLCGHTARGVKMVSCVVSLFAVSHVYVHIGLCRLGRTGLSLGGSLIVFHVALLEKLKGGAFNVF